MNFDFGELEWEKKGEHWLFRSAGFTAASRGYALQADRQTDRYDAAQTGLIVYCSSVWERKSEDEGQPYVSESDSESSYGAAIESIGMVHAFASQPENEDFLVSQPEKKQRIDEGDLFQEGLRVGVKKASWKEVFEELKGENWLRVVERGPFDKDPQHYSHALRQVVPAHLLATEHPCRVNSWEWYPHYLRPEDVLARAVIVVDYSRYVLNVNGVPRSTRYRYDPLAYTRMLKVKGSVKGRYEYFNATY